MSYPDFERSALSGADSRKASATSPDSHSLKPRGRVGASNSAKLIFAVFQANDRPGLADEWFGWAASAGGNVQKSFLFVVRERAVLVADISISSIGAMTMGNGLEAFQQRTGTLVSTFDVRDAPPGDPLDQPRDLFEMVICTDDVPYAAADAMSLLARHRMNLEMHVIERFRSPHSSVVQARQRFVFEPSQQGWDRFGLMQEMEQLVSGARYRGVVVMPPHPIGSIIW